MTPLDQAFIKAYGLSDGIPVPTIAQSTRPIPLSQAIHARKSASGSPSTEACREAAVRARQHDLAGLPDAGTVDALTDRVAEVRPESPSRPEPTEQPAKRRGNYRLDAPGIVARGSHLSIDELDLPAGVGTLLPERPPVAPKEVPVDAQVIEPDEANVPEQVEEPADVAIEDKPEAPVEEPVEEPVEPPAEARVESQVEEIAEALSEKDTKEPAQQATAEPARDEQPPQFEPPAEEIAEKKEEPLNAGPFETHLQTDRFNWPAVCDKLARHAEAQIGRLADAVETGLQRGRKVVGLGGLARGEGCTTLLLCVARQLAARGVRTLLIDADAEQPQLTAGLGLAPEATWQDLEAGQVPLEEIVIESAEDRLAVLPCRRSETRRGRSDVELFDDAAAMARLRAGYDLVLVDLGPLNRKPLVRRLTATGVVDAVLLVHNVRTTPTRQIVRLSDRLAKAGIAQAGIAENFVPATASVGP